MQFNHCDIGGVSDDDVSDDVHGSRTLSRPSVVVVVVVLVVLARATLKRNSESARSPGPTGLTMPMAMTVLAHLHDDVSVYSALS